VFGTAFGDLADEISKSRLRLLFGDAEPVDRLSETQIRVDAGDDDSRIDRQQLDTDK
jgi:hypothetical protein